MKRGDRRSALAGALHAACVGALAFALPLATIAATGCSTTSSSDASSPKDAEPGDAGWAAARRAATPTIGSSPLSVLVFTRTMGFRHDSIPNAITSLEGIAPAQGWRVTATEDPNIFTDDSLATFDVVAWVLTSGDVLDDEQQGAFERFIHQGHGYVGVHSATDTEYDWPWYGALVGAYFEAHPAIQPATIRVERERHAATIGLPSLWSRTDEWYAFRANPREKVQVLLSLDETSYAPLQTAMGDHPIAWYHGFDGGRAFYTALGHTQESWTSPDFLAHVAGGIDWAGGRELPSTIVEDFVGTDPGTWDIQGYPGRFPYDVGRDALFMHDLGVRNQQLARRGVGVDTTRPYAVEALFTIPESGDGTDLNSFCLNVNVAGPEGDLAGVTTWSSNVDLAAVSPGGVMKRMGFVDGHFISLGNDHVTRWGTKGTEYLLRVGVNVDDTGAYRPKFVTPNVSERGVLLDHFTTDFTRFPYQPQRRARLGVNTHGTDWRMRGFRAYYLD